MKKTKPPQGHAGSPASPKGTTDNPIDVRLPGIFESKKDGYRRSVFVQTDPNEPTQKRKKYRRYEVTIQFTTPEDAEDVISMAREAASEVLERERIFDWKTWRARVWQLTPSARAAVYVMSRAERLETLTKNGTEDGDRGATDGAISAAADPTEDAFPTVANPIVAAVYLGKALERLRAQEAWEVRNAPDRATQGKARKVEARRDSLAQYIRATCERPDKRPGKWYDGFREAYPQHAASDRTLKADYPLSLAIVRKQAKPGATKPK